MTEQDYKELLIKPEIPMDIWYEFFLEKGGANIGLSLFVEAFTNVLIGVNMVTLQGKPKHVSLETALRKFYQHYNQKFGL